jgi:hypothetical protein
MIKVPRWDPGEILLLVYFAFSSLKCTTSDLGGIPQKLRASFGWRDWDFTPISRKKGGITLHPARDPFRLWPYVQACTATLHNKRDQGTHSPNQPNANDTILQARPQTLVSRIKSWLTSTGRWRHSERHTHPLAIIPANGDRAPGSPFLNRSVYTRPLDPLASRSDKGRDEITGRLIDRAFVV